MKHIFRGMLALLLVSVFTVGIAMAADQDRSGLIRRDITITEDGNIGCAEVGIYKDSLNFSPFSKTFTLPATNSKFGYFLTAAIVDTIAATAVVTDSLFIRLERQPDGVGVELAGSTDLADGDAWTTVYTFGGVLAYATNWPQTKHIPLDSVAVYPIGPGTYRWIIYGGGASGDHHPTKAYKLALFVEFDPKASY